MQRKTKEAYAKMWSDIAEAFGNKKLEFKSAHFDFEQGAVSTFRDQFPNVTAKMCVFHTKQCLDRYISGCGLYKAYRENEQIKKIVRMIGALQFVPQQEIDRCLALLHKLISNQMNFFIKMITSFRGGQRDQQTREKAAERRY